MTKRYQMLYRERIGNYLHAREDYRREIFSRVREMATVAGLTFALCMEFRLDEEAISGDEPRVRHHRQL